MDNRAFCNPTQKIESRQMGCRFFLMSDMCIAMTFVTLLL